MEWRDGGLMFYNDLKQMIIMDSQNRVSEIQENKHGIVALFSRFF